MRTCHAAPNLSDRSISSCQRPLIRWSARAVALLAFAAIFLRLGQPHDGWRDSDSSSSPFATAADFTKYALKLEMAGVLNAKPIVALPRNLGTLWKRNIVTTIFWIGEPAGPNNPVSNERSSWDFNWIANYGGNDPPEVWNRTSFAHSTPDYWVQPVRRSKI